MFRRHFKIAALAATILISLLVFILNDDQEVFFQSLESKTSENGPVFNKIKSFRFKDKDVWMMNQSHQGPTAAPEAWDRLAIVVDKTKSPREARFYQLEPGPLEWQENLPEKPYRVSCFMCHSNGPRNIRPQFTSAFVSVGFKDRLKIAIWNLQMKWQGRVIEDSLQKNRDQTLKVPFRHRSRFDNEVLKVAVCVNCHKESGFLSRGSLHRQQITTIRFMVESGQMPPMGWAISGQDRQALERFLNGF